MPQLTLRDEQLCVAGKPSPLAWYVFDSVHSGAGEVTVPGGLLSSNGEYM